MDGEVKARADVVRYVVRLNCLARVHHLPQHDFTQSGRQKHSCMQFIIAC